jgi:hypothetical protein
MVKKMAARIYAYAGPDYTGSISLQDCPDPIDPRTMSDDAISNLFFEFPLTRRFFSVNGVLPTPTDGNTEGGNGNGNGNANIDWLTPMLLAADVKLNWNENNQNFNF